MATINNLLAKSKLVSITLRGIADRVEVSDKSNDGDNVTIISIYEWLVKIDFVNLFTTTKAAGRLLSL